MSANRQNDIIVNTSRMMRKIISYGMTYSVAHWSPWYVSLAFYCAKGRYIEHTNAKSQVHAYLIVFELDFSPFKLNNM